MELQDVVAEVTLWPPVAQVRVEGGSGEFAFKEAAHASESTGLVH